MSKEKEQKIFTDNLNYFIELSGKSQKAIADYIGVSPQTFNTWVKEKNIPRMDKIQALADYFHIPKSMLIEERIPKLQEMAEKKALLDPIIERLRNLPPEKLEKIPALLDLLE